MLLTFAQLEANLHHRVLTLEWLNHVDAAVVMGSAIHILIASTRSWSKTAIGKRRGTLFESGGNPTAKKNGGLTMCWWRGGQLSRRLFNWKVLPRSLISKAARQGMHFLFSSCFRVCSSTIFNNYFVPVTSI